MALGATVRDINLRIKVTPATESKKNLDAMNKVATNWEKVFGDKGDKKVKNHERHVSVLRRSWEDLSKSISGASKSIGEFGSKGAAGLQKLSSGIDSVARKIFNLKNVIVGSAIGGGLIFGAKKFIEEGTQQIRTRNRLRREFGAEAKDIEGAAGRIAFRGGIQDDEAARGLIPLAEQLQQIQEGATFRGIKGPLSRGQADALRKKNLNFGAKLFGRISAMAPDVDSEELGRVLGDALAGPEGIRSLISTLHLSKRSRTLSQANEKGQAFKALSPEERKRFGVTRAGQFLEQGDLVNLVLERSGITEAGADAAQKNFSHQIRQIKSTLLDQLGEVGASALDTLTEKLGKGATAAQRLQDYLKSDEGRKTIDSIKQGVVSIVEGIVKLSTELPKIGRWLSEHKGTIAALAAVYGAGKVISPIATVAKAASGSGALGLAKAIPVVGAGLAGLALGAKLGQHLLDKQDKYDQLDLNAADAETRRLKAIRDERRAARGWAQLGVESPGKQSVQPLSSGDLVAPIQLNNVTQLHLDGDKIAEDVQRRIVRGVQNRTANGAAPVARE